MSKSVESLGQVRDKTQKMIGHLFAPAAYTTSRSKYRRKRSGRPRIRSDSARGMRLKNDLQVTIMVVNPGRTTFYSFSIIARQGAVGWVLERASR
jgi:hypothetical protein